MLQDEKIFIVPYNPKWPEKFEQEKKVIESVIGRFITGGIHHIGSTAIPGLAAKPIVDIMVGVENLKDSQPCINLLAKIDYQYSPYKADQEHWFCKPSPEYREFHLHLISTKHPEFRAKLAFRDYLRSHPLERDAYQKLKIKLAQQFENDREAYTQAKEAFVKAVVEKVL